MLSDSARFIAVIDNLPLLRADAAVVLCGQDAEPRVRVGVEIMAQDGAATLVLSGGVHRPPEMLSASEMIGDVYGGGISPSRVVLETESTSTRDQAVAITDMAAEREWKRILIIASPYHVYRAFLTFLQRLIELGLEDEIQVVPVAAGQVSWFKPPDGSEVTRLELLDVEFDKIAQYEAHVAGMGAALNYLTRWDARQWDPKR